MAISMQTNTMNYMRNYKVIHDIYSTFEGHLLLISPEKNSKVHS